MTTGPAVRPRFRTVVHVRRADGRRERWAYTSRDAAQRAANALRRQREHAQSNIFTLQEAY